MTIADVECLACGFASPREATCPDCGAPKGIVVASGGPVGTVLSFRKGIRTVTGVALRVESASSTIEIIDRKGKIHTVASSRASVVPNRGRDDMPSAAGRLLAAALDATNRSAPSLRQAAIDATAADLPARRGLLIASFALNSPMLADLEFTETERSWWRALFSWRSGDQRSAIKHLGDLPPGRYASAFIFRGGLDEQDIALVRPSPDGSQVAASNSNQLELARMAFMARCGDAEASVQLQTLAEAAEVHVDAGAIETLVASSAVADGHAARFARIAKGAVLAPGGGALEELPQDLLDDLIDDGHLAARHLSEKDDPYLWGRVDISQVPDDELLKIGAYDEAARRCLRDETPIPEEVPAEVRSRWLILDALKKGVFDPTAELPAEDEQLASMARALSDRASVPTDAVLSDPSFSKLLEARSEIDAMEVRDPGELSGVQRSFVARVLLGRSKAALFDWRWLDAAHEARECLRFAQDESQRDEALNLIACARWQLGDDESASKALASALEGKYTEALVANMAVVVRELDSEAAALYLSQLVLEAPSLPMRLAAARQATNIWLASDEPWANEEDLPGALRDAMRSIVVEDIPESDFRDIAHLLAVRDGSWLGAPRSLDKSPHVLSDAAKVWRARARDLEEFVVELARVLRRSAPAWAAQQRDALVAAATEAILTEEPDLGALSFSMLLIDKGLPMDGDDLAVLRAFTARGVAMSIDPEDGEPADRFLEWLEAAKRDLSTMPEEFRERARGAIDLGFNSLGAAYYLARATQLQKVAEMHEEVVYRIAGMPRRNVDRNAVRSVVQPGIDLCKDTDRLLTRLLPNVGGELRTAIAEMRTNCRALQQGLMRLSR